MHHTTKTKTRHANSTHRDATPAAPTPLEVLASTINGECHYDALCTVRAELGALAAAISAPAPMFDSEECVEIVQGLQRRVSALLYLHREGYYDGRARAAADREAARVRESRGAS
jgi:hypothetical protein